MFSNVRKFVHYLFSCNLSEIFVMFVATLAGLPLPLLPVQILWLNLVTDVFPALALAAEPAEPGLMARPPEVGIRARRPPVSFLASLLLQGGLLAAVTLGAFLWALHLPGDAHRTSTVAFLVLGTAQLFHVLNERYERGSIFVHGFFGNPWILAAITLTAGLMLFSVSLPMARMVLGTAKLSLVDWAAVAAFSLVPFLLIEACRFIAHRDRKRGAPLHQD